MAFQYVLQTAATTFALSSVCFFFYVLRSLCQLTFDHTLSLHHHFLQRTWAPSLNHRSKLKGQCTDVKSGCVTSVGPSLNPHSLSFKKLSCYCPFKSHGLQIALEETTYSPEETADSPGLQTALEETTDSPGGDHRQPWRRPQTALEERRRNVSAQQGSSTQC